MVLYLDSTNIEQQNAALLFSTQTTGTVHGDCLQLTYRRARTRKGYAASVRLLRLGRLR